MDLKHGPTNYFYLSFCTTDCLRISGTHHVVFLFPTASDSKPDFFLILFVANYPGNLQPYTWLTGWNIYNPKCSNIIYYFSNLRAHFRYLIVRADVQMCNRAFKLENLMQW